MTEKQEDMKKGSRVVGSNLIFKTFIKQCENFFEMKKNKIISITLKY